MALTQDPYAVLGVERSASDDEIRTAYRKLARKHHPDVNPDDPGAEARFKQIGRAYEVLGDPDRRRDYDEFGEIALQSGFDRERARAYRQWQQGAAGSGQTPRKGVDAASMGFDFDLGDLFGMGFGRGEPRGPRRGADLHARVELELAQAVRGAELGLQVPNRQACTACSGSGAQAGTNPQPCRECNGSGQQQVERGPMRMIATCTACAGQGHHQQACAACRGSGHVQTDERVTVRIPPGADDGSTLRIAGKGGPGQQGGPPGDLVIETRVRPHPFLRREGLDLHMKLPVSLDEAYNGAQIEIPTFSGSVRLSIPPGSQPGTRLRLQGKGVRRKGRSGDLYVELEVRLPEQRDAELADAIRRSRSAYQRPVRERMVL